MADIDINKIQQNIKELQDQNAIDFQKYELLSEDIEAIKEDIEIRQENLNLLITKINTEIAILKQKVNKLS